jgi:hypothetical protein
MSNELFPKGIPISPFPNIQRCLGLETLGIELEVLEGFARVGYDFKVTPADESCFFNLFEKEDNRYKRLADAFNFKIPDYLNDKLKSKMTKNVMDLGKQLAKKTGWW